jgi:hypothetical protein
MSKAKKKKINVELIPEFAGKGKDRSLTEPYLVLAKLRESHHTHLDEARIAMVWRKDINPDRDNRIVLGWAKKATDLSREFSDFDLVILLNRDAWNDLTLAQRTALVDHELCHFALVTKDGEPVRDERGRLCYRLKKHDLEEFRDVISRHGLYLDDVARFAAVCAQARQEPLFAEVAGKVGT